MPSNLECPYKFPLVRFLLWLVRACLGLFISPPPLYNWDYRSQPLIFFIKANCFHIMIKIDFLTSFHTDCQLFNNVRLQWPSCLCVWEVEANTLRLQVHGCYFNPTQVQDLACVGFIHPFPHLPTKTRLPTQKSFQLCGENVVKLLNPLSKSSQITTESVLCGLD